MIYFQAHPTLNFDSAPCRDHSTAWYSWELGNGPDSTTGYQAPKLSSTALMYCSKR